MFSPVTTADPDGALDTLIEWRQDISLYFSWFLLGSKALRLFFLLWIVYKFGHLRLGDEKPEYSGFSYFAMSFSAGLGVGLFVFGVSEPLWHQESHFYANQGHVQDAIDQFAINLTVTHWGLAGWVEYATVTIAMALAQWRFGLMPTFRSIFYPILGDYIYGWMGDLIDVSTLVVTVSGLCTSLGLGAVQIVDGFVFLGWVGENQSDSRTTAIQNVVVWWITLLTCLSVISGIRLGIRILSIAALLMGSGLLFVVLCFDDTKFMLNLIVQETGYYFQHSILELNFWTDAFGQLREGSGRAIDGGSGAVWWMDAWTIFYQAWWYVMMTSL